MGIAMPKISSRVRHYGCKSKPLTSMGRNIILIEYKDNGSTISLCRERPATKAERAADNGAKIMVEWVIVKFSKYQPSVTINRDLCGR